MTITPDKSALAQARERLERAYDDVQPWINRASVMPADLRLVLDALAEAERERLVLRRYLSSAGDWLRQASSNVHEALDFIEKDSQ